MQRRSPDMCEEALNSNCSACCGAYVTAKTAIYLYNIPIRLWRAWTRLWKCVTTKTSLIFKRLARWRIGTPDIANSSSQPQLLPTAAANITVTVSKVAKHPGNKKMQKSHI